MRRAGHNSESLSAVSGIATRTIRAWLQRYRAPSLSACEKVAPHLGIKPLTLFKATHAEERTQ